MDRGTPPTEYSGKNPIHRGHESQKLRKRNVQIKCGKGARHLVAEYLGKDQKAQRSELH